MLYDGAGGGDGFHGAVARCTAVFWVGPGNKPIMSPGRDNVQFTVQYRNLLHDYDASIALIHALEQTPARCETLEPARHHGEILDKTYPGPFTTCALLYAAAFDARSKHTPDWGPFQPQMVLREHARGELIPRRVLAIVPGLRSGNCVQSQTSSGGADLHVPEPYSLAFAMWDDRPSSAGTFSVWFREGAFLRCDTRYSRLKWCFHCEHCRHITILSPSIRRRHCQCRAGSVRAAVAMNLDRLEELLGRLDAWLDGGRGSMGACRSIAGSSSRVRDLRRERHERLCAGSGWCAVLALEAPQCGVDRIPLHVALHCCAVVVRVLLLGLCAVHLFPIQRRTSVRSGWDGKRDGYDAATAATWAPCVGECGSARARAEPGGIPSSCATRYPIPEPKNASTPSASIACRPYGPDIMHRSRARRPCRALIGELAAITMDRSRLLGVGCTGASDWRRCLDLDARVHAADVLWLTFAGSDGKWAGAGGWAKLAGRGSSEQGECSAEKGACA
ncbi:hypothetical protein B0H13DRAFT_1907718 [Mycena leptocephala]|nr:hypothetical protein B0H13DRAFT_1907718 [Mycena leptocephala]